MPTAVGLCVLVALHDLTGRRWCEITSADICLIFTSTMWIQVGLHSGKELPIPSALPPFTLLSAAMWDSQHACLPAFHDTHHRVPSVNFGMTPWMDELLGTLGTASSSSSAAT